jgi:hypothetical protein
MTQGLDGYPQTFDELIGVSFVTPFCKADTR